MSNEVDVKVIFLKDSSTIVGNVAKTDLDGVTVTIENPAYIVPAQQGFQIVPLLDTAGVAEKETSITINLKEDIRFGKLFEIDEALGEGYKQTFGYSVIQVPDQKLILD